MYSCNLIRLCLSLFMHSNLIIATRPNLVLILTDDQDLELFGMMPMVKTKRLLAENGIFFNQAFVTTPICCPSRASILTGRYAHNHGTRNNSKPGGCSSKEWVNKMERLSIGNRLHELGYVTMFAGKYLNRYGKGKPGVRHVPKGWDWWNGLVGNSVYYNYTLSVNGTPETHGDRPQDYLTKVVMRKAALFLDFHRQHRTKKPLFLMLCPPAPHAPFTPTSQYRTKFNNTKAPRTPNFNIHGFDKHWLIRHSPSPLSDHMKRMVDNAFRNRWRTLLSVDDLVEGVVQKLEDSGILSNTYIMYSSDNGFHLGQFSLPWDKRQPYEFDVRVPLIIRGPDIPRNVSLNQLVLNIDLAPTLLHLVTGAADPMNATDMDGRSLIPLVMTKKQKIKRKKWRNKFLIEYWGEFNSSIPVECPQLKNQSVANCYADCSTCQDAQNNTYNCVRTRRGLLFCQFQDRVHFMEMYHLHRDPYQMRNVVYSKTRKLIRKYKRMLEKLKRCQGSTCP